MAKGNLYSCPTAAAKFGKDFYYIVSSSYLTVARDATTAYGVNSFAVMYDADNYLGSKGAPCEDTALLDWGPNYTYMEEHGKSKVAQIQQPSTKVYFSDFSYIIIYDWMYDPIKVYYHASNGRGSNTYAKKDTLAEAAGYPIVQARWHGAVDKKTGYGYGNMGWFDGSVSREPKDYADFTTSGGGWGGTTNIYKCWQYFYIKH
jgi:prepilin-type processing-associated H-X9-DG protein